MQVYDNFTKVMESQPAYVQAMERHRMKKIAETIARILGPSQAPVRLLEVGIGTGQFCRVCQEQGWDYTGLDRNKGMVERVGQFAKTLYAEVPPFPNTLGAGSYDVTYSSFVVEHLRDGIDAYEFISGFTRLTKPDGLVVIIVPDCLSLKMEFWNLDYTHRFPTTERNLRQIFLESGLNVEKVIKYRGPFLTGLAYAFTWLAGCLYNYKMFEFFFGKKPLFYSAYQYVNQDILFFLARKPASTEI